MASAMMRCNTAKSSIADIHRCDRYVTRTSGVGRPAMRNHGAAMEAGLMPKFETQASFRRNLFASKQGTPGMIEIILTVCAVANPANCEEKYLQFAWDGSLKQCVMAAQPYIAEWIGNHPEWVATKWSCDYPGHEKRRI
jgi:hypothetical protein